MIFIKFTHNNIKVTGLFTILRHLKILHFFVKISRNHTIYNESLSFVAKALMELINLLVSFYHNTSSMKVTLTLSEPSTVIVQMYNGN